MRCTCHSSAQQPGAGGRRPSRCPFSSMSGRLGPPTSTSQRAAVCSSPAVAEAANMARAKNQVNTGGENQDQAQRDALRGVVASCARAFGARATQGSGQAKSELGAVRAPTAAPRGKVRLDVDHWCALGGATNADDGAPLHPARRPAAMDNSMQRQNAITASDSGMSARVRAMQQGLDINCT